MRKLFVLMATAFLALGTAGVANTAVLNWEGTARVSLGDDPEGVLTGGGVATINGPAGDVPAHLSTLRLAASRGQIEGTFTRLVTDPVKISIDIGGKGKIRDVRMKKVPFLNAQLFVGFHGLLFPCLDDGIFVLDR